MVSTAAMAGMGMAGSALSGIFGAMGAGVTGAGQKLGVQQQMLSTMGQIFGLKVQAQQYGYKANVDQYQADISAFNRDQSYRNAAYARDVGEVSSEQSDLTTRANLSMARVGMASSGVSLDSVTAGRVRESMISVGQYNASVIRANAAKLAYNYDVEAVNQDAQSKLYTYASTEDKIQAASALQAADLTSQALPLEQEAMGLIDTSTGLNAMSSLVGGATGVSSKYLAYQRLTT